MSGFAGGFLKGTLTGVAAFVLGFSALSVILPPEPHDMLPQQREDPLHSAELGQRAVPETATPQGITLPPLAPEPEPEPVRGEPEEATAPVSDAAVPAPAEAEATEPAPEVAEPPADDTAASATPEAGQAASVAGQPDDGQGVEPEIMVPAEQVAEPSPEVLSAPTPPPVPAEPAAEPRPADDTAPPLTTTMSEPPLLRAPGSLFQPAPGNGSRALPQVGAAPAPLPQAAAPVAEAGESEEVPGVPTDAPAAESAETEPDRSLPITRPGEGQPRQVEGVVTGRLPSIGPATDAETGEDSAADRPEADAPVPQPDDPAQPAHIRFAAPHDAPENLPRLSVVLVDAEPDPDAEAALLSLDVALSVALDPADDDAPRRAQAYRAAGHEVLILGQGLPARATPADIEVTFSAWSALLPQAVGLLDPSSNGLQGNVVLARLVMPALAERGLGVVLPGGGLGGARQAARAEGVVNAVIFRDLDQGSENRFTIRRYIDRAVFEAQRQGGVVLVGRANHLETIEALALWRTEGRVDSVGLVPVSALLQLD